jgi:aryl-alcohol dehydrogenase-like predicted oxidoreductase
MQAKNFSKSQRLGLGTVQFGMNYGKVDPQNQTSAEEVAQILSYAYENGIRTLDTAFSYGNSESVLGSTLQPNQEFEIVTKTPTFGSDEVTIASAEQLLTGFNESLKRLNKPHVYGLLIHHAQDLIKDKKGHLFSALEKLKSQGLVKKIGISVYTGEEVSILLKRYSIDLIQIPINILDQRLIQSGALKELKEKGVEVHARSVFLQGLLLLDPERLSPFFKPVSGVLKNLRNFLTENKLSAQDGALLFVKKIKEIDCVLTGVNNLDQLNSNLESYQRTANLSLNDFEQFAVSDATFLNPALWK